MKWGKVDDSVETRPHLKPIMFIGEFQHTIDTKGRMAVPAKFRNKLSGGAIITRGIDHCLFMLSPEEWDIFAKKLLALPVSQANSRAFVRLMLSGAHDVELDAQGRILIPENLRSYAGLSKEVCVNGVYNRIEIWDAAVWGAYKTKTEGSSEEIAEQLGGLGI